MSRSHRLLGGLIPVLAFATLHRTQAQGIEYDVTIMGKVPGSYLTYSRGLNDHGDVVGMAIFIPRGLKAWTWNEVEGFTLLPQPPGLTDYGAVDINDGGVIAGDGGGDGGEVWRFTDGTFEVLGFLAGTPIPRAAGINETGTITGTCFGTLFYNPRHSFIAEPGTPMGSLLDNSEAYGINDLGQVTGTVGNVAYRSTPGEALLLLPPLGERFLTAGYSINDAGNIVGVASSTVEHSGVPFLYSDALGMEEIGDFGGRAFATDVSDLDEVVGEWEPTSGNRRPWVWSRSRGVRFLNEAVDPGLGLRLRSVFRINRSGQIICDARDEGGEIVQLLLDPRVPGPGPRNFFRRRRL